MGLGEQRAGVRRARQDGRFRLDGCAPLSEDEREEPGGLAGGERAERGLRIILMQSHHGLEQFAVARSAPGVWAGNPPDLSQYPQPLAAGLVVAGQAVG